MTKPVITFTMQQAIDYITEKLQDDFSSDFKFLVEISSNCQIIPAESQKSLDNPEANSDNPWLIPDEDGWFKHDCTWNSRDAPEYINLYKLVYIEFHDGDQTSISCTVGSINWKVSTIPKFYQVKRWKYA
jgi:hypothetical protein